MPTIQLYTIVLHDILKTLKNTSITSPERSVDRMSEKKVVISSKRYRGESMVVSIRLPSDLVGRLDDIARKTGRTRNEIIQKFLVFSIDNVEIKEVDDGNN